MIHTQNASFKIEHLNIFPGLSNMKKSNERNKITFEWEKYRHANFTCFNPNDIFLKSWLHILFHNGILQ